MEYNMTQSTLKVLFNFNKEETDTNDYSAYTFVSTVMLLVINMFADELNVPIEYYNRISSSSEVDIYINFNDEDGVYGNSTVEMIWPHYQNRYCLIYSNTRKTNVERLLSFTHPFIKFSLIFSFIQFLCIFLILRYRLCKPIGESFGRALSYESQMDMMLPIPNLKIAIAEKFYLASNFIQSFLKDKQIQSIDGYSPGPITDFGIGEPCLQELKQGLYLRRGCFLACDIANKTLQNYEGVVLLDEEINFQQMFKISKRSEHYETIKKFLRRYFEAGILVRTFNDIHESSHKYLEETRYASEITLKNLYDVSREMIALGYIGSIMLFVFEILFHRWEMRRRSRIESRSKKQGYFNFTP